MESNSAPSFSSLSAVYSTSDYHQAQIPELRNVSTGNKSLAKRGVVKRLLRNQKSFLDLFNKYQCEVSSLQLTIESKFKKINAIEAKLLKMTRLLNSAGSYSQVALSPQTHHFQAELQPMFNSINMFNESSNDQPTEGLPSNCSGYSQVSSSFMEPIIDIHVNEEEECSGILPNGDLHYDQQQMEMCLSESEVVASESVLDNEGETGEVNRNGSKGPQRKDAIPVASKTEFIQLVEKYKQSGNLLCEKVGENVVAMRLRESETLLGYQCTVEGCKYSHYLRAQVNRHYKNYHNKTCSHCNRRFKRPVDLLIHMNENNLKDTMIASK